jgi:hypothetical protein
LHFVVERTPRSWTSDMRFSRVQSYICTISFSRTCQYQYKNRRGRKLLCVHKLTLSLIRIAVCSVTLVREARKPLSCAWTEDILHEIHERLSLKWLYVYEDTFPHQSCCDRRRIRSRIFVHYKSAEQIPARRNLCKILPAENPPNKIRLSSILPEF